MPNPWDNDPVVGGKTSSPAEFAQVYGPAAERAAKTLGVDPQILLGQWGLETGWGKSIIPGTNNLGNIKDFSGSGVGATDNMTGSRDKYRQYASPEDFADDFASLIQRKYPNAVGAKDARSFGDALKAGGYAEDPRYVDKITQAYRIAGNKPNPVLATVGKAVESVIPSARAAGNPWDNDPIVDAPQEAKPAAAQKRDRTTAEKLISAAAYANPVTMAAQALTGGDFAIGGARGVKDVIDTGAELLAKGYDKIAGQGQGAQVAAMNKAGREDFAQTYGDSKGASAGRLAGNVAATVPVTSALGAGAAAAGLPRLGAAIGSGGMTTGAGALPTLGAKAADMGIRMAGGAIAGGASAGAIDPASAGTGAAIGAALPPVAKGLGLAGTGLANVVRGPKVPDNVLAAAARGQESGYVVPPTQVSPSLRNRLLEGLSGKTQTAQNASARNQDATNRLARQTLGLADDAPLTQEALDAIRNEAGQAYAAVSRLGPVDAVGANLPKSVNVRTYTDPYLIKRTEVDAADLVQSWKQANHDATGYYRAYGRDANPETLAKAKAAANEAKQIDKFLADKLDEMGQGELLKALKDARVRIAKTYSVESAMNPSTGNVDARILAKQKAKGKFLSEGLDEAAAFAAAFPKAAQPVEAMGSLPQLSPLDMAAAGGMLSASGSPVGLLGLLARPAARATLLSSPVQRGLTTPNRLLELTSGLDDSYALPLYRAAPLQGSSR